MMVTAAKQEANRVSRVRKKREVTEPGDDDDALYLTEILVDSQRPPTTAPAVQRPWPMMVPKAMM